MHSIFYDLETSDKLPIGQIINFAFIHVDSEFNVLDKYCGLIRLSRLQLPSPEAILANRTDVREHQVLANLREREFARQIVEFIESAKQESGGQLALVGFNSNTFDIDYLRTTLIRNGISPYFKNVLLRDLYHAAQWLSIFAPDFPRRPSQAMEALGEFSLKLTLENLAQRLGLLEGKQLHSSEDDVLLTIELAKVFRKKFDLDICSFSSYQAVPAHKGPRASVYNYFKPNRDLLSDCKAETCPMTLLDADYRSALWIDLERYRKGSGQESIRWFNQQKSAFLTDNKAADFAQYQELAERALKEFENITLGNFFSETPCDIERHIYRLDFSQIELLHNIIWQGKNLKPDLVDTKSILARYKLANYEIGSGQDQALKEKLRLYALYRYGGKCLIEKHYKENSWEEGAAPRFHETLAQSISKIDQKIASSGAEDLVLMQSLKQFYLESEIMQVAGKELLPS